MGAVGCWFQCQLANQISESWLVSGEVPGHFRITPNNIGFKHFDLLMVYLAVHVTVSMEGFCFDLEYLNLHLKPADNMLRSQAE